ncbi:hypothetical protein NKH53_25455 [Mesorhizobium australicum]
MARCAGFDADQARRQGCKECDYILATQLPADNHCALRVNAVHLKHVLGDIQTDGANLLHGRLSLM